jgi:hypothetical protein
LASEHPEWAPQLRPVSAKSAVNSRRRRTAVAADPEGAPSAPWLPLLSAIGAAQETVQGLTEQVVALEDVIARLNGTVQELAVQHAALVTRLETPASTTDGTHTVAGKRPTPSPRTTKRVVRITAARVDTARSARAADDKAAPSHEA